MIAISLSEAARVTQGRLEAPEGLREELLGEVSIDSRCVRPGQCFVPVVGKRLDAHRFIPEALAKGARTVVHSRPVDEALRRQGRAFLQVGDTTRALQDLARHARRKWNRTIVGITGSMGKTTTRDFCAALLAGSFRVFQSPGNFNNEIGLPLALLQLREEHELALLELAMNHPGEIRLLSRICSPDAAVLTNVAAVHLEFFSGLDELAAAKGEILEGLAPGGLLVYNADDPHLRRLAEGFAGLKVSFGLKRSADVRVTSYTVRSLREMEFEMATEGGRFSARLPFAGVHFLYNLAAAAAVALSFGLEHRQIREAVSGLQPLPMRGRIIELKDASVAPITLLDDSYNSNPQALRSVLQTVRQLPGFARKVLVLGEMLELGEQAPRFHFEVGQEAAETAPDLLVTVGALAGHLREGALSRGYAPARAFHFADSNRAGEFLKERLQARDFVLVKGSRGVRMERVIDCLRTRWPE